MAGCVCVWGGAENRAEGREEGKERRGRTEERARGRGGRKRREECGENKYVNSSWFLISGSLRA